MNFDFGCKGCADRRPGCHDSCEKYREKYAEFAKLRDAERSKAESGRWSKGHERHHEQFYTRHNRGKTGIGKGYKAV